MNLFESLDDLKQSGYIFRITDNGGESADRFTITFCDGDYFGSSTNPCHPQGVGMSGEGIDVGRQADRVESGIERDLRWIDLPEAVRDCVFNMLNQAFADYIEAAPAAATREEARNWQGIWQDHFGKGTPIYRDGDVFRIRDDERCPPYSDEGDPGPFATFRDAVRYMLPQEYDLSGPEYFTTVDLWSDEGGPAPLWDRDEDPPVLDEGNSFAEYVLSRDGKPVAYFATEWDAQAYLKILEAAHYESDPEGDFPRDAYSIADFNR